MINNSNITKKSTDSKNKKDASDSTKNTKKASSVDSLASKPTANLTASTIEKTTDSKNKKDASDSTKNKSSNMLPLKLDDLKNDKKDDKDKEQLSYYEKQVLKELKGIKKASKNILKTLRKINS